MWQMALAGLGAGLYSGNQQANAAERAAQMQNDATMQSLAEQKRQFGISQNNMAPWMRAGQGALAEQQSLMGLGGDSEASLRSLTTSPGYQFRLQQGQRGLDAGLAARGGMGSGKAMNAATEYGQNYASNEYNNRLSQLSGLSSGGYQAASGMGGMGQQYAGNFGNLMTGNANSQGAATMAGANARQSGLLGGAQLGLNMYDYFKQPSDGGADVGSDGGGDWLNYAYNPSVRSFR